MRVVIIVVTTLVVAVSVAVGGVLLARHLQTNVAVEEIRRDAEARRQAVIKEMRESEEQIRVWRQAAEAEAAVKGRAWQDGANKLCGRDHFDTPEEERTSVSRAVHCWLDGVRRGRPASWNWYQGSEPLRLYAVQDYEIVDWLGHEQCVVRIHSSTPEGQPTVRLYIVTVRGCWIKTAQPQ